MHISPLTIARTLPISRYKSLDRPFRTGLCNRAAHGSAVLVAPDARGDDIVNIMLAQLVRMNFFEVTESPVFFASYDALLAHSLCWPLSFLL